MKKTKLILLLLLGFGAAHGMEGVRERASNLWRTIENWWYGQPSAAVKERYREVLQDVKEDALRKEETHKKEQQRERKKELMKELISTEVSSVKKKLQKAFQIQQAQVLQFKILDPVLLRFLQIKITGKVIEVADKPYSSIDLYTYTNQLGLAYWYDNQWMKDKYSIVELPPTVLRWNTRQYYAYVYNNNPDTLVVVDASTGEEKWRRSGLGKRLIEADSPVLGKYVVLTDEQPYLEIIDIENGATLLKLALENGINSWQLIRSLFSSDYSLIIIKNKQGEDVSLDIYEIASGKKIRSISIDKQVMDYQGKGDYISLSIKETEGRGRVEIYDMKSGKKILIIKDVKRDEEIYKCVEASSDDASSDSSESLSKSQCDEQDSDEYYLDVAWGDKGKLFAATIIDGENSKIDLYNVAGNKVLLSIPFAHSPKFFDIDRLLSVSTKQNGIERIDFYDIATGQIIMSIEGAQYIALREWPLLEVRKDDAIELYNIQTGEYLFSIDKSYSATVSDLHRVSDKIIDSFYNLDSGLHVIDIYSRHGTKIQSFSTGDPRLIQSDDGKIGIVRYNSDATTAVFYNISTGEMLQILYNPDNQYPEAYLRGTKLIVHTHGTGRVLMYDLNSGGFDRIAQVDGDWTEVKEDSGLIFSRRWQTVFESSTAHIYALESGEELISFDNLKHSKLVMNGRALAILTRDNNVDVYLIPSGQKIFSWNGRVMDANQNTLAILQGKGKNQKLFVFDVYKLSKLHKQLNVIFKNIHQFELLEGFAQAIKDKTRIHANEAQWQTFLSLPQNIQDALRLYIKQGE